MNWHVVVVAFPTDDFQKHDPIAVNVYFFSEITPERVFRCHIPSGIYIQDSTSSDQQLQESSLTQNVYDICNTNIMN